MNHKWNAQLTGKPRNRSRSRGMGAHLKCPPRFYSGRVLRFEFLEERRLLTVVSWVNPAGGAWEVGSNWSNGTGPGAGDDAVIDLPEISVTYSSGTHTVRSLTNEATVAITGGSLTITDDSTINNALDVSGTASLTLDSLTLEGTGTLTNAATLQLSADTINADLNNQGTLLVPTGVNTINGALTTATNSIIQVRGNGAVDSAALTVANGFTNNGVIELTAINGAGNTAALNVSSGTLTNAASGSIQSLAGAGGSRILNAQVTNLGTLTVSQNLTMSNSARTFTSTSGTIQVDPAKVLTITDGATALGSASLLSGGGQIDLAGTHALNLASDLTLTTSEPTLTFSGIVTVNGPGVLTNAATLQLSADTINADLNNQGTLLVPTGVNAINGALTTATNSIIRVRGDGAVASAALTVANGFTNNGVIELTAINGVGNTAALNVTSGTLTNAASGSIQSLAGAGGPRSLNAQVTNLGTLTVEQSLTINNASALPLSFDGSGTLISSAAANLTLTGDLLGGTQNADLFRPQGIVLFSGSPRNLEVMSQDLGAVTAGFSKNFAYGTLELGGSTTLVDLSRNTSATSPEALYVDSLVLPAGATLDLNGLHVYARTMQVAGTVLGGVINQLASGGSLLFSTPTSGTISSSSPSNDWTFFGRANQAVTVVVHSGSQSSPPTPLSPALDFAQVQVLDDQGNVLATASNTQSGTDASLFGVPLAADGIYHVHVQPPAAQNGSSGNYSIALWDALVHTNSLNFNHTTTGRFYTGYEVDHWTFSAQANDQVQFNLLNESTSDIQFDLVGPNGYTAFSNATVGSGLVTLPSNGAYVLTAHSMNGQTGAYAFSMAETSQTSLTLGVTYQGTLVSSGQPGLYTVAVPEGGNPLLIHLSDSSGADHNELFLSLGAAPTRSSYQYRYANLASADQEILVPSAAAGTWYILLYGYYVPQASQFTLVAGSASILLTGLTPDHYGTSRDPTLALTGAGFDSTTTVRLLSAGGATYTPNSSVLVSAAKITATFDAGAVPAGQYSVEVVKAQGGGSATLANSFTMVQGGVPVLKTQIIVPNPVGGHAPAVIYVEYSNTGDVAMPAPVLEVTATRLGLQGAFLTLDPSLANEGFISFVTPPGFSQSVQILASGSTPGVLQPGESETVPVYYAGWLRAQLLDFQYPPIIFTLGTVTTDTNLMMNWSSQRDSLRPVSIPAAAWNAIYANLEVQFGASTQQGGSGDVLGLAADFVQTLDGYAAYLAQLGEDVTDINQLWSFAVQQAIGFSPIRQLTSVVDAQVATPGLALQFGRSFSSSLLGRYEMSPLGSGWTLAGGWGRSLQAQPDGTVDILDGDGSDRRFQPGRQGGYVDQAGDHGTLTAFGDGTFTIRELNGIVTGFRADGRIGYVQDTDGNRITAGYTGDLLTSLTHSSGQFLHIAHNSAGLIASVTDSDGRTTTYQYDATNTYLLSVTGFDGRTTSYTYSTGGTPQTNNALLSIKHTDNTFCTFFDYDAQGRLADTHHEGGAEETTFAYGPTGTVAATAAGGTTTYFFDQRGLIVDVQDPLGNTSHYTFDADLNLTQVIDPAGQVYTNRFDANGNLIQSTDPLGHSVSFGYAGSFNALASATDGNGNTTGYGRDSQGNLLAITYPNGSQEQFSYDPLGNLTESINRRGQAIHNTYNSSGQLTREDFADGTHTDFAYDSNGNLTSATDSTGTTTLEYDAVTEVLKKITYPAGRFLQFTYDAAGRRIQSVDQDGFTVNYQYDRVGRLSGLTDGSGAVIVSYSYDAAGRLANKVLGNGTSTSYAYDLAGHVLHVANFANDGVTVNSRLDYAYDALGRRTSMATLDGQWTYAYDAVGELTHAVFVSNNLSVLPNQDLQYFYDAAGNRTQTILNGVTTLYVTNNLNEYTSVGADGYSYDADGNLISQAGPGGASTYSYDEQNQLLGATTPTGVWSYQYDPFGNRIASTQNGQTTQFLIDPIGLGNVVGEYNGAGGLIADYTYGSGLTSRVGASGGAAYYDFDALGSTVGLSGSAGTYVNRYSYLPFGKVVSATAAVPNPFQYIGALGIMAEDNGLDFMRARFYDSAQGRFVQNDPIGIFGGMNTYRYVRNNPISHVDPAGLGYGDPWDPNFLGGNPEQIVQYALKQYYDEAMAAKAAEAAAAAAAAADAAAAAAAAAAASAAATAAVGLIAAGLVGYGLGRLINQQFIDPWLWGPPPIPPSNPSGSGSTSSVGSTDPNGLYGPAGYGAAHFVAGGTLLPYRIDFENAATAYAPAQSVTISNQLDPNLDWTTFQLTAIGFGDNNIIIPPNSQYYQSTVSMTYNGQTFNVALEAGLNPQTGQVYATFQSLDPNTALPPGNVLTGFLPPEDGTGRGDGYVSYLIQPKSNWPPLPRFTTWP